MESNGNAIVFSPTFSALNGLTTWAMCFWINQHVYISSTYTNGVIITGGTYGNLQFNLAGGSGTAYFTFPGASAQQFLNISGWANGKLLGGWYFAAITCTSNAATAYWKSYSAVSLTSGGTGTAAALPTSTSGVTIETTDAEFSIHDVMFFSQALTSANFLSIASTPANASSIAGSNLKFWAPLNGSNPETDSSGNGYSCSTMDPWVTLLSVS